MNKTFGGFLGQEKPPDTITGEYHNAKLIFNTARACLSYTLQKRHIKKIHLPYYICDSVISAIIDNNKNFAFYGINEKLEIDTVIPKLANNEAVLYVNYFGLKNQYIARLEGTFGEKLVIDNSQAFFQKSYQHSWSFNSARKFFGVTDGAYLYAPDHKEIMGKIWPTAQYDNTYLHERHRGSQQKAYQGFLNHEQHLSTQIKSISTRSHDTLKYIDYAKCANSRKHNFLYLHKHLSQLNELKVKPLCKKSIPLYYPFLFKKNIRNRLIKQGLFIPCLWQEVKHRSTNHYDWEKYLASNLLALPIDHRYDTDDMQSLLKILQDHL